MRIASDEFKVTMSAVAVRAMRLGGMINAETTGNYLAQLREEFQRLPKGGPRSQILPENAVRKYNGRELSRGCCMRLIVRASRQESSAVQFV